MSQPLRSDAPPQARLRASLEAMPSQQIAQIADYGRQFDGVIPLWFGESDVSSPPEPIAAAKAALDAGRTFYAGSHGEKDLRQALSDYMTRLHGQAIGRDRVLITASGMSAIACCFEATLNPGDSVVIVDPVWPNAAGKAAILSAEVRRVSLEADDAGRWHLDLDRLFDACDDTTRAIFVNSPNNPTGWLMTAAEQQAVLDFARSRGIWIISDEVYNRLVFDGEKAPSFLDIAGPDDPVLAVNSFSKTWAMTGWRLGWITAPARCSRVLVNIIEFNTSGAPQFVQAGGVAAVQQCEPFVAWFRDYCRAGRDKLTAALAGANRIRYAPPEAAFYGFFQVEGERDSLELAKRLVREARVGVAPGISFGPGSEGWLRLCFAQSPQLLDRGLEQMMKVLR